MNQFQSPLEPQPLRFEPDEKRLARLARFRRIVLLSTLGVMVVALVLVLLMPSRVMVMSGEGTALPESEPVSQAPVARSAGDNEPSAVIPAPAVSRAPAGEPVRADPQAEAWGLVRTVDSCGSLAREQWMRAGVMVTAITVRLENVPEILKRIGIARAITDSAQARLSQAEATLEQLKGLLRVSGVAGTRINAAYAAAREYVSLISEEAGDRQGWLDSYEQAIRALGDNDSAQFEIKMNVAGAYERKSDVRQKRLNRAEAALRSAAEGLK
ncbi:MAG: hypothetical protein ABIK48_03060 [candidate division WOR-3 bacterium]